MAEKKTDSTIRLLEEERSISKRLIESIPIWASFFILVCLFVFMRQFRIAPPPEFTINSIATRDYRAPFSVQIVDESATQKHKEEVIMHAPIVLGYDSKKGSEITNSVTNAFIKGRIIIETCITSRENRELQSLSDEIYKNLSSAFGEETPRFVLKQFYLNQCDPALEKIVSDLLREVYSRPIAEKEKISSNHTVLVHQLSSNDAPLVPINSMSYISLLEAQRLPARLTSGIQDLSDDLRAAIEEYIRILITPTLVNDPSETAKQRDLALSQVIPLTAQIKKGQIIVRGGDHVDSEMLKKLEAFKNLAPHRFNLRKILSLIVIIFLMLTGTFIYLKTYRAGRSSIKPSFALFLQILSIHFLISDLLSWVFTSLSETSKRFPFTELAFYEFAIPVGLGAMLVTVLMDRNIAILYSMLYAILMATQSESALKMTLYSILTSFASIYFITRFKQRIVQFRASIFIAIFAFIVSGFLLLDEPVLEDKSVLLYLFPMSLAFIGVIPLSLVLFNPLLSIFQILFGILSDVRLLELSKMNHQLLLKLAMEAPGTYSHSITMSSISEAAASAIGANALFCRVACYYHDIGKLKNPQYFIENQRNGINPHDRCHPRMSSLIISAHVKDGIDMAKKQNLPQQIIDLIPQHHGTRRISYFYDKALKMIDPERDTIDENDFCYPGPRPQTREAAIIMLADGIEAANRVLRDSSPAKIKHMIQEVTERAIEEEQLEQCNLTFKELDVVQNTIYLMLLGSHSQRISYPSFSFDKEGEGADTKNQDKEKSSITI